MLHPGVDILRRQLNRLSILYLRCPCARRVWLRRCRADLSILYLRCSTRPKPSSALYEATFNSLFEMQNVFCEIVLTSYGTLSILYLRCRELCSWRWVAALGRLAFNSLFEMREGETPDEEHASMKTFNSLFEMLMYHAHRIRKWYRAFNSLFEMLPTAAEGVGISASSPFNSLFEMHRIDGYPEGRDVSRPFNSLFEMQVEERLEGLELAAYLSILYLRCAQARRRPVHNRQQLSILYLRCHTITIHYIGIRHDYILSILYLRCPQKEPLFSINVVETLSILYLRCLGVLSNVFLGLPYAYFQFSI